MRTALMRALQAEPRPLLSYAEKIDLTLSDRAPRLYTDASDCGIGIVLRDRSGLQRDREVAIPLEARLRAHPIHVRETYAVLAAIRLLRRHITGRVVRLYVDNNITLSYLSKRGGRVKILNDITRAI